MLSVLVGFIIGMTCQRCCAEFASNGLDKASFTSRLS